MQNTKAIIQLFFFSLLLCTLTLLYFVSLIDVRDILILMIIILGILPAIHSFITGNRDSLTPRVLLPFTYMFYALGPLALSAEFSQDVFIHYLFLQLVGMLSLRFGLYCGVRHSYVPGTAPLEIDKSRNFSLLMTAFGLILLSVPSLFSQLSAFGGLTGLLRVGYGGDRYLIIGSSFKFGTGFEWLLLGIVTLIFYGLKYSSKKYLYGGGFLYLAVSYVLLLIGGRSALVYTAIFGIVLLHYGYRRISSRFIILGMVVGISLAQYYALARYFLPGGLWYAVSQTWTIVTRKPALLLPWSANEFIQPAASLLEMLQKGDIKFALGGSYLSALGAPIPFISRLFAQAGFDPNLWRLQTFHPEVLAAGGGLGYSPVSEGYINFGILGVIAHLFVLGYTLGIIYKSVLSKKKMGNLLLFAGSLPIFMLDGMRIHSASFVYKWTRSYIMPWLIFTIIALYNSSLSRQISRKVKVEEEHG